MHTVGMREGDVILSINGTDMEKADHKTIVTYIKNCDSRMRIVVLFEDCVRKVELHMRYIQLQNVLHAKMNELERTCLKERELLEGKWKTHSLPAPRKKASATAAAAAASAAATAATTAANLSPSSTEYLMNPSISDLTSMNTAALPAVRPISEEFLSKPNKSNVIAPPVQFMLATYQYLDPQCRYILKPSTSNSGEYLLSIGPPTRSKSEHQQFFNQSNSLSHDDLNISIGDDIDQNHHENVKNSSAAAAAAAHCNSNARSHCHKRSCNPCLGQRDKQNNGDNVSLDAYDLASPCCNPECVPTRYVSPLIKIQFEMFGCVCVICLLISLLPQRRSKHKEHKHKHREKERSQRPRSQSHICHKKQAAAAAAAAAAAQAGATAPTATYNTHNEKHVRTLFDSFASFSR